MHAWATTRISVKHETLFRASRNASIKQKYPLFTRETREEYVVRFDTGNWEDKLSKLVRGTRKRFSLVLVGSFIFLGLPGCSVAASLPIFFFKLRTANVYDH